MGAPVGETCEGQRYVPTLWLHRDGFFLGGGGETLQGEQRSIFVCLFVCLSTSGSLKIKKVQGQIAKLALPEEGMPQISLTTHYQGFMVVPFPSGSARLFFLVEFQFLFGMTKDWDYLTEISGCASNSHLVYLVRREVRMNVVCFL